MTAQAARFHPMTPLGELLFERIHAEGPLSLDAFIRECLYHPELGYYAAGKARIGKAGDFYTAVSIGPLLGKLLALQFAQMWETLGRPDPWHLTEQGAFDGQLARDILEHLQQAAPLCFAATRLQILEPFARLRIRQRDNLATFAPKIRWFDSLEDCPPFVGVHYSNELLDAFPARLIRRGATGWSEMQVAAEGAGFGWSPQLLSEPAAIRETDFLSPAPAGFLREICPDYGEWTRALAGRLRRGWALVLDYGLTESELALPHRKEGTLTGYRAHQRAGSVLENPGEQDITHQVNFSAVCRTARAAGLTPVSYATQAQFLTPLGMLHFEDTASAPDPARTRALRAFGTLTHPEAMGHRFKSLVLATPDCAGVELAGTRFGVRGGVSD